MSEKNVVIIDADLEEIIPGFLENRHKDLIKIDEALKEGDILQVESIAHKLAGNAGSYGLDDLGEIGVRLEAACQNEDQSRIKDEVANYKTFMSTLEIKFES